MKTFKNYIYQFSYQLLNLAVPLITLPYITKKLGAENYGEYVYTFTIISYLVLFSDFGLRTYGNREISYLRDDISLKTNTFWNVFITKSILTMVVFLLASIVFYIKRVTFIYWLQLIILIISIIDISWFYQGIEKFKEIAFRNLILKIIFLILIFYFVKDSNDLNKYILIVLFTTLIGNLTLYISLRNEILNLSIKEIKVKKTLKESLNLFLPELSIKLYSSMDRIMIGYFLSKQNVGYYDIANKFLIIIMIIITTFGTIMLPKISNLYYMKRFQEIKKILKITLNYYFMLSVPLMFGVLGTSKHLVVYFLGEEYFEVIPAINLMSFTIILWTINNVTGSQILIPMKKEKILTKSVLVGSIINIILNLILIKRNGIMGVVVATLITETIVTAIQLYYSKEYIEIEIKKIIKYFISSLIMYIFIGLVHSLYLKIFIGCIIYFCLMILLKEIEVKKIAYYIKNNT